MTAAPSVTGYRVGLTCPTCGAPVCHVASGHPTDGGTRVAAIVQCDSNPNHTWQLITRLVSTRSADEW